MDYEREMQFALNDHRAGKLFDAEARYRKILVAIPDQPDVMHMLGLLAYHAGKFSEAIHLLQKSADLRPTLETFTNLAVVLSQDGRWGAALEPLTKALAINPSSVELQEKLGTALMNSGSHNEAERMFRSVLQINPELVEAGNNLLFCLLCNPERAVSIIASEHRAWADRQPRMNPITHSNDRNPNRPLRVGYVSPDFRTHSVAYFFETILANHNPSNVEAYCYSDVRAADEVTVRMNKMARQWRRIVGMSTEKVFDQIRKDRIDLLIDLAGHTADNRLAVFARKPAPIQLTYIGYPSTTGLSCIDYRITDAFADPLGISEQYHAEKLLRLPDTFLCFRPLSNQPIAQRSSNGPVTFGSFNSLLKINKQVIDLWAKILLRTPGSRLIIKNRALKDSILQARLCESFSLLGIDAARIRLLEQTSSVADHLLQYGMIDIALDTFPYNGTATTCEALWMGVPVVVLAGHSHVSRVGVSLLSNVGLPEWIAMTSGHYVKIASDLANNRQSLHGLRSTLREQMLQSPLMNARQFVRNLESVYRNIWQQWCATPNE